jgi:hypothetical protein
MVASPWQSFSNNGACDQLEFALALKVRCFVSTLMANLLLSWRAALTWSLGQLVPGKYTETPTLFASKFYLSQHQIKLRSSLMALNFKAKPLLNKRFWMPMARQSKWVKPWKFFFMVDAKSLSWVNTQAVVAFTFGPQNQAWDLKHFHLRQMPGWITQSKLQSSATIDPNQAANPAQLALASAG